MKKLSRHAAANCEQAKRPRCRCRCGGALHGSSFHGLTDDEIIAQLEELNEKGLLSLNAWQALKKLQEGKQVALFEGATA